MTKTKRVVMVPARAIKKSPFPKANKIVREELSLLWQVLGDEFSAFKAQSVKSPKFEVPPKKRLKQAA